MPKIKRLPDAELEIMNALWNAAAPLTARRRVQWKTRPARRRSIPGARPGIGRNGICKTTSRRSPPAT